MDDFKSTWDKAKQERAEYYLRGGTVKREHIEHAIHKLTTEKR
jgi:hypothetical protein